MGILTKLRAQKFEYLSEIIWASTVLESHENGSDNTSFIFIFRMASILLSHLDHDVFSHNTLRLQFPVLIDWNTNADVV